MKKTLALLLAACLCIGLCGCAPIDELKEKSEKYDRYEDIILALEDEDYDAAISRIEDMKPAPEVLEVNLTMDNWDTYLEIVPSEEAGSVSKDGYGNVEYASMPYFIQLKDGYELDWSQDNQFEMGYSFTRHGMVFKNDSLSFDADSFTYSGEYISDCTGEDTSMIMYVDGWLCDAVEYNPGWAVEEMYEGGAATGVSDENKTTIIETTINEILSVEGTIYLLQES